MYSRIKKYSLRVGVSKCPYENILIVNIGDQEKILIIFLYMHDLIFTWSGLLMFYEFQNSMMDEFEMSDIELMHYFTDIVVVQSKKEILFFIKTCMGGSKHISDDGLKSC